MGRNRKKKNKFPDKTCICKDIFKGLCSSKRFFVKPGLNAKLKEYGITATKNSRICLSCQINVKKGTPKIDNVTSDTDSTDTDADSGDDDSDAIAFYLEDYDTLIQLLKKKFSITNNLQEKYKILTLLPTSWSLRKFQSEFGCSKYMASKAKELQQSKGILSVPDARHPSNVLSSTVTNLIDNFYLDDEISSVMPGKNDYVSMVLNGKKERVQKRLMLLSLTEAYQELKKKYATQLKFSFSYFASRRPKNCVLPGGSGTHVVCVCSIHQNIKLMLMGNFMVNHIF